MCCAPGRRCSPGARSSCGSTPRAATATTRKSVPAASIRSSAFRRRSSPSCPMRSRRLAHASSGSTRTAAAAVSISRVGSDRRGCSRRARHDYPGARILNLGGGIGVPEGRGRRRLTCMRSMLRSASSRQRIRASNCGSSPADTSWRDGRRAASPRDPDQGQGRKAIRRRRDRDELADPAGAVRRAPRDREPDTTRRTRRQVCTVVGPICESGDELGRDRALPRCEEGDVLLIANAGAYGHAMASHYNLRPPAPELVMPA